jgi:hypothetical protein
MNGGQLFPAHDSYASLKDGIRGSKGIGSHVQYTVVGNLFLIGNVFSARNYCTRLGVTSQPLRFPEKGFALVANLSKKSAF